MPSGISKNPLNDISQVYLDSISEGRLANLEKASVLAASDDPKDQDKAREIKTRFDYESLKKQIGSKKKHSKPVVGEGLSDWRDDLREITGGASPMLSSNPVVGSEPSTNIHGTDDQTGRKVVEKKIKNKIKINPTFKEAAEEIAENLGGKLLEVAEVMDDKKDEEDPGLKSKQQKARMIKKQVLMKKLQAVRQGSEDIVAHYEPEGEEVDEACWKGYKAYGMKKKGGKMVPNCKPVGSVKEASAVLDANKKLETEKKTKKNKAELAKLTHIYKGMKKGIYNSYEPEGNELKEYSPNVTYQAKGGRKSGKLGKSSVYSLKDKGESKKEFRKSQVKDIKGGYLKTEERELDERTLSSYIPSDRQGEASAANREYVKSQLKKKEDESTKNRGDLSKRDAGKMAKQRLHNKRIMSMGEAVDEGYGKKKKKKGHSCASKVKHEEYGMGDCIKEMHTLTEDGEVTHYDIKFSNRIIRNVPVDSLEVIEEMHHEHYVNDEKNVEVFGEEDKKGSGSGTKDACYKKVKASAKVWPSAYASGRLVQCRKKGAANYGKSKSESYSWRDDFIWEDEDQKKKLN